MQRMVAFVRIERNVGRQISNDSRQVRDKFPVMANGLEIALKLRSALDLASWHYANIAALRTDIFSAC